ncbi:MAG TPA: hypothetical protein ENI31_05890, partial [Candidatus Omnitrophica bacterium]|nr:hypothetical protein [Candidatus Omnitrophota bacterium]
IPIYQDNQQNSITQLFKEEVIVEEITLNTQLNIDTQERAHPLYILEGSIQIRAPTTKEVFTFHQGEFFLIPACLGEYTLENTSSKPSKILSWYAPLRSSSSVENITAVDFRKPPYLKGVTHSETNILSSYLERLRREGRSRILGQNKLEKVIKIIQEKSPAISTYSQLIGFIRNNQIRVIIDDNEGYFYYLPRKEFNLGVFSILAETLNEEKKPCYDIHITEKTYQRFKDNPYFFAQLIIYHYTKVFIAPCLSLSRHTFALKEELNYASKEVQKRRISDITQFFLDYAVKSKNQKYLLFMVYSYKISKDPQRIFQTALYKAIHELFENKEVQYIDTGEELLGLYRYLFDYKYKDLPICRVDRITEELNNLRERGLINTELFKTPDYLFPWRHPKYQSNSLIYLPNGKVNLFEKGFVIKNFFEKLKDLDYIKRYLRDQGVKDNLEDKAKRLMAEIEEYIDNITKGIIREKEDIEKLEPSSEIVGLLNQPLLEELMRMIESIQQERKKRKDTTAIFIGINGPGGVGKTTITRRLVEEFKKKGIVAEENGCDGYLHLGGNFRYVKVKDKDNVEYRITYIWGPAIYNEVRFLRDIISLKERQAILKPADVHGKSKAKTIGPVDIIIADGVYMGLDPEIFNQLDILVVLDNKDESIRFNRKIKRDIAKESTHKHSLPFAIHDYADKIFHEKLDAIRWIMLEKADIIVVQDEGKICIRESSSVIKNKSLVDRIIRLFKDSNIVEIAKILISSTKTNQELRSYIYPLILSIEKIENKEIVLFCDFLEYLEKQREGVINIKIIESLLEIYVRKSKEMWDAKPYGGSRGIVIAGGLGGDSFLLLNSLYEYGWRQIVKLLRKRFYSLNPEEWKKLVKKVFFELLNFNIDISEEKMALFNLFIGPTGYVEEIYSIPSKFKAYHVHDEGINVWVKEGNIRYDFAFRGTIFENSSLEEGFIRIDPPINEKGFLKMKLDKDDIELDIEDILSYERIIIKELVEVIDFLSGYTNFNKELILVDQIKEIFNKYHNIKFPETITLGGFINYTKGNLSKSSSSIKVKISDPLGIHAKTAVNIVNLAQMFPKVKLFIRKRSKIASATSRVELIRLGVGFNEEIEIIAEGEKEEVEKAKKALAKLLGALIDYKNYTEKKEKKRKNFSQGKNIIVIKGISINAGIVMAKGVLVNTLKDLPTSNGPSYILLRKYADNLTTELFLYALDRGNIKGVVTSMGGKTTHFATVVREANIPYVSGVGEEIRKIQGKKIVLDGNRGIVGVIEEVGSSPISINTERDKTINIAIGRISMEYRSPIATVVREVGLSYISGVGKKVLNRIKDVEVFINGYEGKIEIVNASSSLKLKSKSNQDETMKISVVLLGKLRNITTKELLRRVKKNELSSNDSSYDKLRNLSNSLGTLLNPIREIEEEGLIIKLSKNFGAFSLRVGNIIYLEASLLNCIEGIEDFRLRAAYIETFLKPFKGIDLQRAQRKTLKKKFIENVVDTIFGFAKFKLVVNFDNDRIIRRWFADWIEINNFSPTEILFDEFELLAEGLKDYKEIYTRETVTKVARIVKDGCVEFKNIKIKDSIWVDVAIRGFEREVSYAKDGWLDILAEAASKERRRAKKIVNLLIGYIEYTRPFSTLIYTIKTIAKIGEKEGENGLKRLLEHPLNYIKKDALRFLIDILNDRLELRKALLTYIYNLERDRNVTYYNKVRDYKGTCEFIKKVVKKNNRIINWELIEAMCFLLRVCLESLGGTITTLGTLPGDFPKDILDEPNIILATTLDLGRKNPQIEVDRKYKEVIKDMIGKLISKCIEISEERMCIFTVSLDRKGNIDSFFVLPSKIYTVHEHDQGVIGASIEEARISQNSQIRGTIAESLESSEGFIRIDSPVNVQEYFRQRVDNNERISYEEILLEEIIKVVNIFFQDSHPQKELVFIREIEDMFEEKYGIKFSDNLTLKGFKEKTNVANVAYELKKSSSPLKLRYFLPKEERSLLKLYILQAQREGIISKLFNYGLTWYSTKYEKWIDNKDRLGWLDILERIDTQKLKNFIKKLKNQGFEKLVILGIGGSVNGMVALRGIFNLDNLYILGSVEPHTIKELEKQIEKDLDKTVFFVISKSWTTVETMKLKEYFYDKVVKYYKGSREKAGKHFVVIADPKEEDDDARDLLRKKERKVYHYFDVIDHDKNTGGRFASFFGEPGFVPLAFVDEGLFNELVQDGKEMMKICKEKETIVDEKGKVLNPGAFFGLFASFMEMKGKTNIVYVLPKELLSLATFLGQITAESLGKKDFQEKRRGLVPVIADEEILNPSYYNPSRNFFVYFSLKNNKSKEKIESLKNKGFSILEIELEKKEEIGKLITLINVGIAIAGYKIGVNFADEPGVWVSKDTVLKGFIPYLEEQIKQPSPQTVKDTINQIKENISTSYKVDFEGGTLDYGFVFEADLNKKEFNRKLDGLASKLNVTNPRENAPFIYVALLYLASQHNKTYTDLLVYPDYTRFKEAGRYWQENLQRLLDLDAVFAIEPDAQHWKHQEIQDGPLAAFETFVGMEEYKEDINIPQEMYTFGQLTTMQRLANIWILLKGAKGLWEFLENIQNESTKEFINNLKRERLQPQWGVSIELNNVGRPEENLRKFFEEAIKYISLFRFQESKENLLPLAQRLVDFLADRNNRHLKRGIGSSKFSKRDIKEFNPLILALGSPSPESFIKAAKRWHIYIKWWKIDIPIVASTGRGRGYKSLVENTLRYFESNYDRLTLKERKEFERFKQKYKEDIRKVKILNAEELYDEYNKDGKGVL